MRAQFYILAAVIILSGIYLTARYLNEGFVVQPSAPSDELIFSYDISIAFNELMAEPEREFKQNFKTIQKLVNERSAGSFSVNYNCSGDCPGEIIQIKTTGLSGELNFKFNVTELYQPRLWWDDDTTDGLTYDYRIKLILSENAGVDRENWPFVLTGQELISRGVSITNIELDSVRLVDPEESGDESNEVNGNDIPMQIDHKDGTGDFVQTPDTDLDPDDELVFVLNMSSYEVKDFYIYFSRSGAWSPKSYTSDLYYSDYWVNNSRYFVNYSDGWNSIDRLAVDLNRDGVINETSITNSMDPKITGSYSIYNQTGVIKSGPIRIIIDSGLYEINSSSFDGNVSRRIEHWAHMPIFKMSHEVTDSNEAETDKLQVEYMDMASIQWYRAFYPLADGTPDSGWDTTVVSEQLVPGYLFSHSYTRGVAGFIFTDSPSNYQASEVVQWALERGVADELSRKVWLRDQYSNSSYWESWIYSSGVNATLEPREIWQGFYSPVFQKFWFEEVR
jgi:hypothetical protein